MKTKGFLLSCAIGLGMTIMTACAETPSFIDLSTPDEEIENRLSTPTNPIEFDDSSLESKGFGEEGKGFDEMVNDMPLDGFDALPKIAMQVHFEVDSADIHLDDKALLGKLADVFKGEKLSEAKIVIAGHTDSDSSDRYNLGLSQDRALAVKNFLVYQGVDENRLAIKAFGEKQPFASNASSAGKAKNRRVEFIRAQ
jgi:outer membrane protein OmpA-like peptidoglycan-associated protein